MKRIAILILLVLYSGINASAKETVTLNSLVKEALGNNPGIKAATAKWEASTKVPSQEGSLPNPIIGGRFKNVSFSEITLGEDPRSDIQAFFKQEIPFPGKLSLREKVALEKSESQKWVAEAIKRKIIADLKVAYYNWFFINKSIAITEENKDLMNNFIKIAEAKYEVGQGIQQDVFKAQVELSGFIEMLELLNKKNEIIEEKIKNILNRSLSSSIGKPEETIKSDVTLSLEELIEATKERAPILNASSQLVDSKEQALNLARREYLPDFVVEATYFNRDGGGGDNLDDIWQVGLGIRAPIYFWRKEKFGVDEAALELREVRENFKSTENNLLFEVKENYITAKTAEKLIELYSTGIIPQSTLSLESAISGYQVGDVDFLTLINNFLTLYNFELEYYEQLTDYEISLARIEEITGLELINNGKNTFEDSINQKELRREQNEKK